MFALGASSRVAVRAPAHASSSSTTPRARAMTTSCAVRASGGSARALGGCSSAVTLGGARASYGAVRVRARATLGSSRAARGKRLVVEAMFEVRAMAMREKRRASECVKKGWFARRDARGRRARKDAAQRGLTNDSRVDSDSASRRKPSRWSCWRKKRRAGSGITLSAPNRYVDKNVCELLNGVGRAFVRGAARAGGRGRCDRRGREPRF